ncbi:MAG: hypothetical protein MRK02_16700 [Candidatus Scalindua sp.]|nr:hypothetical protein [Candidatus Scalindua sp.]
MPAGISCGEVRNDTQAEALEKYFQVKLGLRQNLCTFIMRNMGEPEPNRSYKITNLKSQKTNKLQITNSSVCLPVGSQKCSNQSVWNLVFVYCDLFVIWNLLFGAYPTIILLTLKAIHFNRVRAAPPHLIFYVSHIDEREINY